MILTYWGIRGGGARYTFELARAMGDLDDTRVVVSLNAENELLDQFEELERQGRVTLDRRHFSGKRSARAWIGVVPGPWSFGAWAKQTGGHVIVTMGNPLSFALALTLWCSRVPFTHVVHDAVRHPGERSGLMHRSVRWAARLAANVVCLSSGVRDEVVANWRIPLARTSVIPHGPFYAEEAAALRLNQLPSNGQSDERQVLFLGRILPYKGLGLLLHAWKEIEIEFPLAVITLAGDGDFAPHREQFQRLNRAHLQNRWLADRDIQALMAKADLLVLPYTEASQSGVIGIAHSFGVPVLATDVGGLATQIDSPHGDLVVRPTVEALAQGLRLQLSAARRNGVCSPRETGWLAIAHAFQQVTGSGHSQEA